jgi:NAD(P)-dependent dehydrogenase (short-subunit alcohol dehydrogenase family)
VKGLFAKTVETFGRLDLLFNNAGTGAPGTVLLEDLTFAQWTAVVNTNLTGPFLCTQEAFRIMKSQDPMGGRIINNGSISAHAPRPNSDIGNAATDMTERMSGGVPQADGSMKPEARMDVAHVASSIVHMAQLPLESNVLFMTVMATKMPFVGRG